MKQNLSFLIIRILFFYWLFGFSSTYAQNNMSIERAIPNYCEIYSTDSILCEGDSTKLKIVFPNPGSLDVLTQDLVNQTYSGLGDWDYSADSLIINNYSRTYGLPGMMVYGDSTEKYGALEVEIRQTGIYAEANAGIAMAVKQNYYKDDHLYNGPNCYFLAISNGKVELYNGINNTPMGYSAEVLASASVDGLNTSIWTKLKLEILPDARVYGYVNDSLYINYFIPDEKVTSGYFSLVTSNSQNEYRNVTSYYFPIEIYWSTGDTTISTNVSPLKTKDYSVSIKGITSTWSDDIIIEVNPIVNLVEYVSICEGEKYKYWNQSGHYSQTLQTENGCDSMVNTILTVNQKYTTTEYINICEGSAYKNYTTEGQHIDTLFSSNECDSVVITNLTFYPLDLGEITIVQDILFADPGYNSYQWYNKEEGEIVGSTESFLVVNVSGSYYYIAEDENGCLNESRTVSIIYTNNETLALQELDFTIFPNPNDGHFSLRVNSTLMDDLILTILNHAGQIIEVRQINTNDTVLNEEFVLTKLAGGIYFVNIQSRNINVTEKIIIK